MNSIIKEINLLKNSKIKKPVKSRIKEFKKLNKKSTDIIFEELCFCILTANFSAQRGIEIQKKIKKGFLYLSEKNLAKRLKILGYRFPNTRAKYIVEARNYKLNLKEKLNFLRNEDLIRTWLVKNIKGIGMKEASHFLRNIGYENVAIIDFHIIDLLVKNNLIKKPKALTLKKYLEIESILRKIALKTNLTLGELDLYLWYKETGKILK